LTDIKITELLKEHYDVDEYGLRYVRPWTLSNSHDWLGFILTVLLQFEGYENSGACSRLVNKNIRQNPFTIKSTKSASAFLCVGSKVFVSHFG